MEKQLRLFVILVVLALCAGFPIHNDASDCQAQTAAPGDLAPENTVILASQADARFSQDFSTLLRHLRLKWAILDGTDLPNRVRDKNLILLGHPDAVYSGEMMRGLLTEEEIETVRATSDRPVVIQKESPWAEGRIVYICSGANMLLKRNAAEEAIRAIIAAAPPASDWIQTTYDAEPDEDLRDYVDQLRFGWDDEELPLADLTLDVKATPARRISTQEAAEDVERLFYLFSHGYSGYAFFNQQGEFDQAKDRILQELSSQSSWSSDAFSRMLYENLDFIIDCHTRIGSYKFAEHADFWYDTRLELTLESSGYQFVVDDTPYIVASINDGDPSPFIFPSLNQQGAPVYRLGLLSLTEPAPLLLTAESKAGERQFEIELQRSDFDYYSDDIFREDIIGGIPVVRVRSFSDYYADALTQFVETASSHRGEPVIIVDIRGNGGGNEHWPISWIHGLTGQRAEAVFIYSELESKTSMIGRANVLSYLDHTRKASIHGDDIARYTHVAEMVESGTRQADWTSPYYPQMPLIANDTTVIVVTNAQVASAGEGFVMRISRAENVVVVGENSMGCLTFGNISAHQLPHSRLMVWLPINFGLYLDMEFREQVGLTPDLWVPAADGVNYAVAAVRNGTITTSQPLPPDVLQQDFNPENPWARATQQQIRFLLIVALFAAGGSVWAYFTRKKPRMVAVVGAVWIAVGSLWIVVKTKSPVGSGLLLDGVICLVWGGYNLWSARRNRVKEPA